MKNKALIVFFILLTVSCKSPVEEAARNVICRTFGKFPSCVSLKYEPDSIDFYSLEVVNGKLLVAGSSTVALCKGFHDYIQDNGYGCVTWSGARLELPERLPEMGKLRTESPYSEHLFYNVCTFGYSTPYWGWKQWEKELDWLALHGFDMPLAPIGTEAILSRVYSDLGLSWEEIADYFSGPGHFPWMRMGNMCSQDGGMSPEWHKSQIMLQHKILDRMSELGMTPVFQAFAGFVPEAVEKHFPKVKLTRTQWHGLHNQLLSSTDSLFGVIGTAFIREWEKEFGKGRYYLADSFNEMDIPFGERGTAQRYETIKRYSEATYNSIKNANSDAIWVMQGWMFGRDRKKIWDPESVKALLDGAPDDKLMIIDLAVDFNEFVWRSEKDWNYLDGFGGKRWIWSTTPNFGGRTSLKGVYDFYLNSHLEALKSPNKRNLSGYGCSPEGIESNEAIYEAISSAAWSSSPKDAKEFLSSYFAARYGLEKADVYDFAEGLLSSVYDNFTNRDNFDWVYRPTRMQPNTLNINSCYYDAVNHLATMAPKCGNKILYARDLIYFTSYFLGGKADEIYRKAKIRLIEGDVAGALALKCEVVEILMACDKLLESHPMLRMQRWLDLADAAATNGDERFEFRSEALRLTTSWDAEDVRDYASRMWSGMLRDYYVPRLELFFRAAASGEKYDFYEFESDYVKTVARNGFSPVRPYRDCVAAADSLIKVYNDKGFDGILRSDVVGLWFPCTLKGGVVNVFLTKEQVGRMRGFEFTSIKGGPVKILEMKVGTARVSYAKGTSMTIPAAGGRYPYAIPETASLIEAITPFTIRMDVSDFSSGLIKIY